MIIIGTLQYYAIFSIVLSGIDIIGVKNKQFSFHYLINSVKLFESVPIEYYTTLDWIL